MKSSKISNVIRLLVALIFVVGFENRDVRAMDNLRETPVVKAVRKVGPAVVNVRSEQIVRSGGNPFSNFRGNPFFEDFFKDFFENRPQPPVDRTSLGSGVIIDGKRGYILTNAHVIEKAGKIKIGLLDDREFEAKIVGIDSDSDLAVLQISSATALPSIEMGTSDDLMIGETVITIGNPFGFSHTVTTGVVSAVGRSIRTDERVYHDFIQTDASINPGNSGGPLLNINGELIGINTAIYAKAQGIGFAIPIDKAKRIVADLIRYGEVVHPWVGIRVQPMDEKTAQYLKETNSSEGQKTAGVLVRNVEPGSPAFTGGVQAGDIVLEIGNKSVRSIEEYRGALQGFGAGDIIPMKLGRKGKTINLSIHSVVFPENRAPELAWEILGIRVSDALSRNGKPFGVRIVEVAPSCYLARIGAAKGDIIRQIDDIAIHGVEEFYRAIVKTRSKNAIMLLLQRGDQLYHLAIQMDGE
ncbi:trypsin-like peptidase domain-containing protein [Desulfatirhabdium butyrativorans]|uniref:trypsin-like peptidase domain-containing protein n=1 Tax=Desulfatirhabdium butyrativorans TaxID=340467 RepID=UPI0003FBE7E7|nr:trypsin-like peptidase domain-containing protein [Desulfatirhabdium butyrativorans]